jgi:hypothetical protein
MTLARLLPAYEDCPREECIKCMGHFSYIVKLIIKLAMMVKISEHEVELELQLIQPDICINIDYLGFYLKSVRITAGV